MISIMIMIIISNGDVLMETFCDAPFLVLLLSKSKPVENALNFY